MEIVNVCAKCKAILEWKIKYKKYKLPKAPKKCTMCEQKTIKNAYHIICIPCAEMQKVCPKCGKTEEIVKSNVPDQLKLDVEFQNFIKDLTERKRRTFLRCLSEKERLGGKTLFAKHTHTHTHTHTYKSITDVTVNHQMTSSSYSCD
jgi:hypothetical protein